MNAEITLNQLQQLRIREGWIHLRVQAEPYVIATRYGYQPVLPVENLRSQTRHFIYMSAKSFMDGIEPLRSTNDGKFSGLEFRIRKESDNKLAPFVIEP